MKNLIKQIIKEALANNDITTFLVGKKFINPRSKVFLYHGTRKKPNEFQLRDDYEWEDSQNWDADLPEGYLFLTTDINEAKYYGQYIIPCELKRYDNKTFKVNSNNPSKVFDMDYGIDLYKPDKYVGFMEKYWDSFKSVLIIKGNTKSTIITNIENVIPRIDLATEFYSNIINEQVTKTKVICDNCGWSWKIKDGGDDPYVCHNILPSGRMCNHDNTPKKKLNEDLQSNVIFLPYSDDYNEELEDYNIDEYDVEPQALNIAKQNNLNILSDKNLKGFLFDTTNNKIVGALWTSDDNNSFSFDIAIDKQYQGLKLSHLLIKNAIDEYNIQSDYGNFNLPMKVDVINPMLANILKTKYNFRVVKRITNDRVIMALKKNLKEENILNEKCWKGYTQKGMKTMFGKRYPNCVKKKQIRLDNL
jgi:hypothetical protein